MATIRSYNQIKTTIDINNKFIKIMEDHNYNPKELEIVKKEMEKDLKAKCRDFYKYKKKYCIDPLSVPIRNNEKQWRTVANDNIGDSCTDFIIIPDRWGDLWNSDNEDDYQTISNDIEEFVFTTVGYRSMYDFPTGKMITISWDFKRIPCGVAVVHHRGIDW